jgi:kynurenine formamidase
MTRPELAAPEPPMPSGQVIDLTLTLAEDLPCHWSTHQPFQHKVWTWFTTRQDAAAMVYNRGGAPYTTRWMAIDEHTGTHFDAPAHFVPPPGSGLPDAGPAGEITAERVPVEQLMGPAAVIDVTALNGTVGEGGVSPVIGPDLVVEWERRYGALAAPDVVLFRTGWDERYRPGPAGDTYLYDVVVTRRAPGWPAPGVAAMELLLERGIRCVGTDAPSMGAAHDGAPVHVRGLRSGAVFVECLTRLDLLPTRGAWFCFLPLKTQGGTGAPGRAIAISHSAAGAA